MGLTRVQQVLVGLCIVCIIAAIGVGLHGRLRSPRPSAAVPVYSPPPAPPVPATMAIHVAGAVWNPGVHELPRGARVEDAVQAAGGCTAQADMTRVNLAAPLQDGQRVDIPLRSLPPQQSAPPAETRSAGPINLNTATAEQLESLPGIGPARAEDIIRYRMQSGGFRAVDELQSVPGIGPKILAEVRPFVTVQ